uniref:NAD(P)H-quinone oxidoreductase subunit 5, chloroplastic n=1 Tax=Cibotium barometz TaxID=29588 RepID=A0A2S1PV89_CIBBA|nr:NADH-plastoquinone oxidoreductase subunit 5 [Cibotium barometz]AWH62748.1 NADH-plastoquinone oxidoreductase subunit 5 [Cibotium barometz]WHE37962.1 NADH-plastoquinone oxidoreductase subunit 5 [Cibotium barometz]WHE38049.1 NADH-plastoquinone oxidoreductase subunit 5 [Cibotium barometz]WHE38137.1 NADH-plastoquinone oxidoreductase subunit 5 [Cibotium barometz]WHE38746.1 NADH-plastoquinone oxidoreductase subunit 5 [Cibotium barometz]
MFVSFSYEYAWIVPLCPLVASGSTGSVSFFFPKAAKGLRRSCAALSVLSLTVSMFISFILFWQQNVNHSTHQYLWSWILKDEISMKIGFLIDPLTLIMSILVTTVGISVTIYSDSYTCHDQGYVRFSTYLSLFTASMLGLVFSPNLIQIYVFWELVGMRSYSLIGFWFARPSAANACQKAFVTNRIGDFGLLLGILGIYWITGSFEICELCDRFVELISSGSVNPVLANIIALLLFLGPVAKSAQFPLHVWLPDAMEGPTPISALIHAATMVAAGIFFVARILNLIEILPLSMGVISWVGGTTALLGATLALTQRDLKKGLAHSTMSQLGYMVLALGIGAYRSAPSHLITHAYSKASSFLGSGSVIHSMEKVVGYSPIKNQNMLLMGGLRKCMPITGTTSFSGTLSLCGIPPLACFWSKDEITAESRLCSSYLGWIASITVGFTASYMFRIYFLTFEGDFRANDIDHTNFGNSRLSGNSINLWGEPEIESAIEKIIDDSVSSQNVEVAEALPVAYSAKENPAHEEINQTYADVSHSHNVLHPEESDFAMVLPLIVLVIPTLLAGSIGVNSIQKETGLDSLSQWLIPLVVPIKLTKDLVELLVDSIGSISLSFVGIFISYVMYRPNSFCEIKTYKSIKNSNFLDENLLSPFGHFIQGWSLNRGYIDYYYNVYFVKTTVFLSKLVVFFDQWVIDGIINGTGVSSLFGGEGAKYGGSGRISYYSFGLITGIIPLLLLTVVASPVT